MAARKMFIGGNWKCNGTKASVKSLVKTLNEGGSIPINAEVVIAPTALHAAYVVDNIRSDIMVAVQNSFVEPKGGAWTGELTSDLIKDMGITWTVLGHSERRKIIGESSELIAAKTAVALESGLKVILCIGEQLEDRENGKTMEVCIEQLTPVFKAVKKDMLSNVVIAYEPVWAIGTGKTATPEQAQETHKQIRSWLEKSVGGNYSKDMRIIYGGSVKGKNCKDLMKEPDIDGFLVGGASLKPEFIDIIKSAELKAKL